MPKAKDDLGLVLRAAHFAAHKHKDQRRKDAKEVERLQGPMKTSKVRFVDATVPGRHFGLVGIGPPAAADASVPGDTENHQ